MKYCIVFLACIVNIIAYSQVGTGQWEIHVNSVKCLDLTAVDNSIFAAYENGLMEYDVNENDVSVWSKTNSLSDILISCLGKSTYDNSIFIGYKNGNIDKIKNNKVTNLPYIKISSIIGNKTINRIVEHDKLMYFATGFSIIVFDPIKNEVRDTYYPTESNNDILDITFKNDSVFATNGVQLLKASLKNPQLADFNQWEIDNRIPTSSSTLYKEIEFFQDNIWVLKTHPDYTKDSLFILKNNGLEYYDKIVFSVDMRKLILDDNKLNLVADGGVFIIDNEFNVIEIISRFNDIYALNPNSIITLNNIKWLADNENGLVKWYHNYRAEKIQFTGPQKITFVKGNSNKDKVVFAGGLLDGIYNTYNTSGVYTYFDFEWKNYDRYNCEKWVNVNIFDNISVALDPTSSNGKFATGSYSDIPLTIFEDGATISDTFTVNNSILKSINPDVNKAVITDMKYDSEGNLWMLNGYSDKPLVVYTKDNKWYSYSLGASVANKYTGKLEIDQNNVKWATFRNSGLVAFQDNGTLDNTADDKIKALISTENYGGLPSNQVNAITSDLNNNLWVGTEAGFGILYNTSNIFDATAGEYDLQRIKIDFEGNVEYLLGYTSITDIAVDGGNRKWFATQNAGLFLLSPDGLEVLQEFTIDNSKLISNNIVDLEINQQNGEMFIICDNGLVSYRIDASEGGDNSNVKVFPNPVNKNFNGVVTIQGIMNNSDVKITDVAGNLVYKTSSNGGTATWNCKTVTGERVVSGVYLIWTTPIEGKGRKVGKVVITE